MLPILTYLFNRLFKYGIFTKCWSHSILVPIHIKGDINSPNNYRGISLLDGFGYMFSETSILRF